MFVWHTMERFCTKTVEQQKKIISRILNQMAKVDAGTSSSMTKKERRTTVIYSQERHGVKHFSVLLP